MKKRSKLKRGTYLYFLVSIVYLLVWIGTADGSLPEQVKLVPWDNASEDWFGESVSISGDYAVIGAKGDNDNGECTGSAYIFKRDGMNWSEQAKLTASDAAAGDRFGRSVSISGDYVIVGAYGDGSYTGSAYIFAPNEVDPNNWGQVAKLTASDGAGGDYFGYSVSISNDYAIIGAYCDGDNGSASGSAYIFKRDGETWSQQAKLLASDGDSSDFFGCSVSISGDYAVVGAYQDDDYYAGAAYIFKRDGETWAEQIKFSGSSLSKFGYSVSISGDYIIVGTYPLRLRGLAYIFKREGETWSQQAELIAWDVSDGTKRNSFGYSVSINGDYVAVGAIWDDENGTKSGSAYTFKREGEIWNELAKLTASDGNDDDHFGCSVSISGDYAVVGAYYDDDNGTDSGSAYVFGRCPVSDLDGNCFVDFKDFAVLSNQWLELGVLSADIAPVPEGDGTVNMLDVAVFTDNWLQGEWGEEP